MGGLLRLIEEFHDQEKMAALQTELAEAKQELAKQRAHAEQIIDQKERQLGQLQEANRRLQAFSDTVRGTLVYRVYRQFIKPFVAE